MKPLKKTNQRAKGPRGPLAVPSAQTKAGWNSWRWQMRHRIHSVSELMDLFPALRSVSRLDEVSARYPMAITPYYAALIRRTHPTDPIFRLSVPHPAELDDPPFLAADPLAEAEHSPVPGLIHRYPDRALILATSSCAVYCRHCTRKRATGEHGMALTPRLMKAILAYLRKHPAIREIILSGGDPLTLETKVLTRWLTDLRSVQSIEVIRIGTRVPVVLPQRVTRELVTALRRYHPLWINTHFNHPRELTAESAAACARLADAGIPLGNQTVLLRGVNDNAETLTTLFRGLIRMRVRPYYLFQCDLVRGTEHFRTPLRQGLDITSQLRRSLSGLAIPTFTVDAPGGRGKIPLAPETVVKSTPTHTTLRDPAGGRFRYPEPRAPAST